MTRLPIDEVMGEIVGRLREKRSVVVVAPPGAGKTTRVPPAILESGIVEGEHPNVVVLQPRRVAARAVAQRIAEEQAWELGGRVGYAVRFEKRMTEATRLRVMTEGILTRQIVEDPFLSGVGAVVLDEFHERSIHTDLAIAMLKEIRSTVRPDLVIVVMSATLEAEPVSRFLDAPVVRSEGRMYAVDIAHRAAQWRELPEKVREVVEEERGDTLVFLPGTEEIRRCGERLENRSDWAVLPLHGSLTGEAQMAALRPVSGGRRKIVLATNIAETSLTIEGVRTVIDSGLARVAGFDPQRGMDRLELKRISLASATQRAGRAGRTGPGRCVRLYSASEERAMEPFELPEVRRVDLCATVLAVHQFGHADPRRFEWYEKPDELALVAAERLLEMLGAIHAGKMTKVGEMLLELPVHPRVGRLLIEASELGIIDEGATVAALLSEKDILRGEGGPVHERVSKHRAESDLIVRMEVLRRVEGARFGSFLREEGVDLGAARQVARVRDELVRVGERILRSRKGPHPALSRSPGRGEEGEKRRPSPLPSPEYGRGGEQGSLRAGGDDLSLEKSPHPALSRGTGRGEEGREEALLKLPLVAYPDRVCRRRGVGSASAVMVGGGGVKLAVESAVHDPELFVALDARQDERNVSREAIVRVASGIRAEWLGELFADAVVRERVMAFDENRGRVVARGVTRYHDLVMREDADAAVDPDAAGEVLGKALRGKARELFEKDEASAHLMHRVALLREFIAEHPWPTFDDEELGEIVEEAARGKRSVDEVRAGGLVNLLRGRLVYPLDRLLDQHAPETIEVPSGSRIRLVYEEGKAPVLAARLQELFGWTDTPRVAGGRVAVLIHLLAPNYRPVQVTDDLRSFWSTTYFQVRKDLRVRYPKHAWPEDPLTAKAEAKGTRRR
ncbi:MAG TPA: ATP-dependent helicase C-terminal domain-containing protein [Tepidisphaeraceae bacterium]